MAEADDTTERLVILLQAKDKDLARALDRNNKLVAQFVKQTKGGLRGVERDFDRFGKSAESSGRVFQQSMTRSEQLVEKLKDQVDPLRAATRRLKDEEQLLNEALRSGSVTASQHAKMMGLIQSRYKAAEAAAETLGSAQRRAFSTGGGAGGLQNVGYQIQDFAVQVGAGTSASVALGQQLPQLLSGFGLLGVAAGTTAAVLVPLAKALFSSADDAASLEDRMEALTDATQAYADAADLAAEPLDILREKYGDLADEIERARDLQVGFARGVAQKTLEESARDLGNYYGEFSDDRFGQIGFRNALALGAGMNPMLVQTEAEATTSNIAKTFEITREQAALLVAEMQGFEAAAIEGPEALQDVLLKVLDLMVEISGTPEQAGRKFGDLYSQVKIVSDKATAQIAASASEQERIERRLISEYDRNTQKLKQLAADREVALSIEDEGQRQRVVAGIDNDIAQLRKSKERLREMQTEAQRLKGLLEYIPVDESGQMRDTMQEMLSRLNAAIEAGDDLDEVTLERLEGEFDGVLGKLTNFLQRIGVLKGELKTLRAPSADYYERGYASRAASGAGSRDEALVRATVAAADRLGVAAADLLTVMSFETGGTFRTDITNATGHTGLIQFSKDNQARYGVSASSSVPEQVEATVRYLMDRGIKPGDGLHRIYAAINTGSPNKGHLSDAKNGGTWGSANDKVDYQMGAHRSRAQGLLAAHSGTQRAVVEGIKQEKDELTKVIKLREQSVEVRQALVDRARQSVENQQLELSLMGKSAEEQARLRTEYMLTEDAKRRGIDLNEKMIGQEKTYGEYIREQAEAVAAVVAAKKEQAEVVQDVAEREKFLAGIQTQLKDGLIDAIVEGKNFADVLSNVAKMLAKAALQAAFFNEGPMASSGGGKGLLGGLFDWVFGGGNVTPSAKGNVFSGGRVQPFAKGGVVDGPVLFPMRGGTGLMGEAGPEAIMPLSRGADGKLGVRTNGGGSAKPQDVHINVNVAGARGNMEVQEMVAAGVRQGISQYDQSLPRRVRQIRDDPRKI